MKPFYIRNYKLHKSCRVDLYAGAHGSGNYAGFDILTFCCCRFCLYDSAHKGIEVLLKLFGAEKLQENFDTLMGAIVKAKPAAAKGQYVKSCVVSATMGPGVKINPARFV